MIVLLHNIRSLHNVGSIFRTADAAGVKKIYLCGITPAPIDKFGRARQPIAKIALGAEKYLAWEKIKSSAHLIDKLKKDGYIILAAEQSKKAIPYYEFNKSLCSRSAKNARKQAWQASQNMRREKKFLKIALILGNELKGLPRSILNRADCILEIPMHGKKESLNVAVAFGIIAFHLLHISFN